MHNEKEKKAFLKKVKDSKAATNNDSKTDKKKELATRYWVGGSPGNVQVF